MNPKSVLIVDDEQWFLEALDDALTFEGFRVLKARDVSTALEILQQEKVDLITIDVMLSPGTKLEGKVDPLLAGVYLCERVAQDCPEMSAFCISVITDPVTIMKIQHYGIRFLRKGETPLRTILNMIRSRLTGLHF